MEEACGHLKTLENELKNRFFGGEKIGVVDIVANFIGFWLGCIQEASGVAILTEEKFPKLHKWSGEFVSCDVVKENLPPRYKLIACLRSRFGASK
ncbi:hypothetical protein Pint_35295 [Pistacia integerrima]|uniref:Uncharacterized protein n=1 Tax=Pistacia integerrima TaxID=434235 RepID=A0ACC0Y1J5_9ROSI|nr:hypothetical protein Pint_35295 [Pistacia integerrima]